ncbi:hypothetical protein ACN082_06995 [Rothia sp. CCM 9417]|uniref:hypothetical protein n=1 Tax=Rothia sp. CCM 9417 TaxID=3402657 RepID=UPI003AE9E8D6
MPENRDIVEDEEQVSDFFTFAEDGEEDDADSRGSLRSKLAAAGIMLLVSVVAFILLIGGVRTFNEARANEGYENRSWVISGAIDDVTPDLQSDKNVAIYSGKLPDDSAMAGKTFVSDVADPASVNPGDSVKFRGSQTGRVSADFPQRVDALLAQTSDTELIVVRTGTEGSLVPVTEDTVSSQKRSAILRLGGAILVFGAGFVATFMLIRKRKDEEFID